MQLRGERDEDTTVEVQSDTQRQDQERTHPRNNENDAGFQKDHRETIELVRECDEERRRTHTEESVEGGYIREKELRTTENKIERRMPTRLEKYRAESGTGRCGEGRSAAIPATLHGGESQGKIRRIKWLGNSLVPIQV